MSLFQIQAQDESFWVEADDYAAAVLAYRKWTAEQSATEDLDDIDQPERVSLVSYDPVIRAVEEEPR